MKLALLAAGWLAGTFIGLKFDPSTLPLILLLLAALATGALFRLYRLSLWPMVLSAVLLVALLRVESGAGPVVPLFTEPEEAVTLQGRIVDDPEAGPQRIKLVIAVDAVAGQNGLPPIDTKVLAYVEPPDTLLSVREPPYFKYGDTVLLEGRAQLPKDLAEFDYLSYLTNQGISGVIFAREVSVLNLQAVSGGGWRGRVFDLRRKLSDTIEEALSIPQSAVAQALLLGKRDQLPDSLEEEFRGTGTSHLLAISGLHVGALMITSLAVAAGIFGRRWGIYLVIPLILIWSYALLSGLPTSVIRAAIMGTVYLAAMGLGRPRSVLPALALSAAAMTAYNPQVLQQVSFQLSFAAMAGIALALPIQDTVVAGISNRVPPGSIWDNPWIGTFLRWTAAAAVVSVAATMATWPLVAFNFDRVPLLGILITMLALPALPLILFGALATSVLGLIHPALGELLGWVTWVPLSYLVELVKWAPGVTVSGTWLDTELIWAWYMLLASLLLVAHGAGHRVRPDSLLGRLWQQPAAGRRGLPRASGAALAVVTLSIVLIVASAFVWAQVFSGPDGRLHVYFFDVGQGDSALIVTPTGKQVLVDGGPESESATSALTGPLPGGDRSLDLVVLTHLDADHSRGLLKVLDRYHVASVLVGMEDPDSAMYPQWQASIERGALLKIPVRAGYRVVLEPDVVLEILNPPARPIGGSIADQNNNSLVLRLIYRDVSFLLAADIEMQAETRLALSPYSVQSSVLKVAHHGSRTSTTTTFLLAVDPSVVVVSVGSDNRFGHPTPEVMDRLEQRVGIDAIYRTDQDGTIELVSDGESLWVKTER